MSSPRRSTPAYREAPALPEARLLLKALLLPAAPLLPRTLLLPAAPLLLTALLLLSSPPALAADTPRRHLDRGAEALVLTKPEVGQSKTANPSHVVNEGGVERSLWIDTTRVAEFPQSGAAGQPALRPAEPGELSDSARTSKPESSSQRKSPAMASDAAATGATSAGAAANEASNGSAAAGSTATGATDAAPAVSPVFVDASGRPRALPGGVIVSLKQGLPEAQAQEQLQAAGLTPLRRIGERMWLVDSPVGLASLELANRLHATGRFDFVQPNWWQPRTTK